MNSYSRFINTYSRFVNTSHNSCRCVNMLDAFEKMQLFFTCGRKSVIHLLFFHIQDIHKDKYGHPEIRFRWRKNIETLQLRRIVRYRLDEMLFRKTLLGRIIITGFCVKLLATCEFCTRLWLKMDCSKKALHFNSLIFSLWCIFPL